MNDDLVLTLGAATILGVAPDSVRRLARNGQLPVAQRAGGVRLFDRATVERVAAERRAKADANHKADDHAA